MLVSVFSSDVAVEGYFGRIASSALLMWAVDGLLEFFPGLLSFSYSLEMRESLSKLTKTVSNFHHEISKNLFDSIHFGDQIVCLCFQSLEGSLLFQLVIGSIDGILSIHSLVVRNLGVLLDVSKVKHVCVLNI